MLFVYEYCIISDDAEEGWETVQRGKPNRSRPSSAKRTVSSRTNKQSKLYSKAMTAYTQQQQQNSVQGDLQNNNVTPTSSNGRDRTDSEKENRPIECNRNIPGSVQQQIIQAKLGNVDVVEKLKPASSSPPLGDGNKPDIKDEDPSIIKASPTGKIVVSRNVWYLHC